MLDFSPLLVLILTYEYPQNMNVLTIALKWYWRISYIILTTWLLIFSSVSTVIWYGGHLNCNFVGLRWDDWYRLRDQPGYCRGHIFEGRKISRGSDSRKQDPGPGRNSGHPCLWRQKSFWWLSVLFPGNKHGRTFLYEWEMKIESRIFLRNI